MATDFDAAPAGPVSAELTAAETAAQIRALLDPLRWRERRWITGELDDEREDPERVRAQQLVLRLEKNNPPRRQDALVAAARAAVAMLADPRSGPEGEWYPDVSDWVAGRIRKVARRARGAHWRAAASLPGTTAVEPASSLLGSDVTEPASVSLPDVGAVGPGALSQAGEPASGGAPAAEVRAFPPYLLTDVPKNISRLQVGGTDLPRDPASRLDDFGGPVVWLTPRVDMTLGKTMAQVGHASMLLATYLDEPALADWLAADLALTVRQADPRQWADLGTGSASDPESRWKETGTVAVRDAGYTEVDPGTVTVIASWPAAR